MMQAEYRALSELEKSCADRRLARKAKIVLLAHQGWSSTMISREVGVSAPTAETVVRRYHHLGRAGLFGKQWVKLRTRERKQLTQLSQSPQGDALKRVYAKVVLDASQGIAPKYLALQHKLSPSTVRTLLYRFENRRLAALEPASYGGREANKARWARVVEQWPAVGEFAYRKACAGSQLPDFAGLGGRRAGTHQTRRSDADLGRVVS